MKRNRYIKSEPSCFHDWIPWEWAYKPLDDGPISDEEKRATLIWDAACDLSIYLIVRSEGTAEAELGGEQKKATANLSQVATAKKMLKKLEDRRARWQQDPVEDVFLACFLWPKLSSSSWRFQQHLRAILTKKKTIFFDVHMLESALFHLQLHHNY